MVSSSGRAAIYENHQSVLFREPIRRWLFEFLSLPNKRQNWLIDYFRYKHVMLWNYVVVFLFFFSHFLSFERDTIEFVLCSECTKGDIGSSQNATWMKIKRDKKPSYFLWYGVNKFWKVSEKFCSVVLIVGNNFTGGID